MKTKAALYHCVVFVAGVVACALAGHPSRAAAEGRDSDHWGPLRKHQEFVRSAGAQADQVIRNTEVRLLSVPPDTLKFNLDSEKAWQARGQEAAAQATDSAVKLGADFAPWGSTAYSAAKASVNALGNQQAEAVRYGAETAKEAGIQAVGAMKNLPPAVPAAVKGYRIWSAIEDARQLRADYQHYKQAMQQPITVEKPINVTVDDFFSRTTIHGHVSETFTPIHKGAYGYDIKDSYKIERRLVEPVTITTVTGIQDPIFLQKMNIPKPEPFTPAPSFNRYDHMLLDSTRLGIDAAVTRIQDPIFLQKMNVPKPEPFTPAPSFNRYDHMLLDSTRLGIDTGFSHQTTPIYTPPTVPTYTPSFNNTFR